MFVEVGSQLSPSSIQSLDGVGEGFAEGIATTFLTADFFATGFFTAATLVAGFLMAEKDVAGNRRVKERAKTTYFFMIPHTVKDIVRLRERTCKPFAHLNLCNSYKA